MGIDRERRDRRKPRKLKAHPKPKTYTVNGVTYERGMSPVDAPDAPSVLSPYRGDDQEILSKVDNRRAKLLAALDGAGGVRTRFARPGMFKGRKTQKRARRAPLSRKLGPEAYRPDRRGNLNHHYYFFPVFEWAIVREYNSDNERQGKIIRKIDSYEVLVRYFGRAKIGSRAVWSVRPPRSADYQSNEWVVRQTLKSYKKHGLDKKQLRELIAMAEDRLQGYAIVIGVRGVWRSPFSEEMAAAQFKKLQARMRAETPPASAARKPKRSRKI